MAQENDFDILISDVIMPGDNGPALAKNLRMKRPDLPVIFMSGFTEHAALRNSVWEDGDVLLVKPFEIDDLIEAVKNALKMRGISSHLE